MFIPPKGRAWFREAEACIRGALGYQEFLFRGKVKVDFMLVPPTARMFDIDNRDKALFDVLQKACLIMDDAQIYTSERWKLDKQPKGCYAGAYIRVQALPNDYGEILTEDLRLQWEAYCTSM